jgi:hypothetical protein
VQDKFWVEGGPHKFEVYTVLADADVMKGTTTSVAPAATTSGAASVATTSGAAVCCAPQPQTVTLK